MTQAQLLSVLLKGLGFWSLAGGMSGLPQALRFAREYPDEPEFLMMVADTFAAPIILILSGLLLIRQTDRFLARADMPAPDANDEQRQNILAAVLKALGYWEILNGMARAPFEVARLLRGSRVFDGVGYAGVLVAADCVLVFATKLCVRFAYQRSAMPAHDSADEIPSDQGGNV